MVTVSCPAEGFFPVGGLASAAEGGSHGPWDEPGEALSGAWEHNLASLDVARKRHVLDGNGRGVLPVPDPGRTAAAGSPLHARKRQNVGSPTAAGRGAHPAGRR